MQIERYSLFPTVVYRFSIPDGLTEAEVAAMRQIVTERNKPNVGNLTSVDAFVLRQTPLNRIQDFCHAAVAHFVSDAWNTQTPMRITESWLNLTTKGGYHHAHTHPNSIVSGVLYVSVGANDKLLVQRSIPFPWEFNTQDTPDCVAFDTSLAATPGTLLLFPSTLSHRVPPTDSEERISLSFNTFAAASFGGVDTMTYLPLNESPTV